MSNAALNWAFGLNIKPTEKFILISLADSADDYGYCFPSYKTITKKTNYSRSTVIRAIEALTDQGLIEKQKRVRTNGSDTSNIYKLALNIEVADDHPLVSHRHPPSTTQTPPQYHTDTPNNPNINLNKKREMDLETVFIREIDKAYQEGQFKPDFEHLTETEIKEQIKPCLEFLISNNMHPKPENLYLSLRTWIRKGIRLGVIRKPEKAKREAQEIKFSNPEQTHHQALKPRFSEADFTAWIRPLWANGNSSILYAPNEFTKSELIRRFSNELMGYQIEVKKYQEGDKNAA